MRHSIEILKNQLTMIENQLKTFAFNHEGDKRNYFKGLETIKKYESEMEELKKSIKYLENIKNENI